MAMAELKFPVTEIDNDKFQAVVDLALYAKEAIVAACYKLTDRFFVHQQAEGVVSIYVVNRTESQLPPVAH